MVVGLNPVAVTLTGSRLAKILGFYVSKKVTKSWDIMKNGIPEKAMLHIINIKRIQFYEDHTLQKFMTKSNTTVKKMWIF